MFIVAQRCNCYCVNLVGLSIAFRLFSLPSTNSPLSFAFCCRSCLPSSLSLRVSVRLLLFAVCYDSFRLLPLCFCPLSVTLLACLRLFLLFPFLWILPYFPSLSQSLSPSFSKSLGSLVPCFTLIYICRMNIFSTPPILRLISYMAMTR